MMFSNNRRLLSTNQVIIKEIVKTERQKNYTTLALQVL